MKSPITTHILDLNSGRPAANVEVQLEQRQDQKWSVLSNKATDIDGRISDLLSSEHQLVEGVYRLIFSIEDYTQKQGRESFYPKAVIVFRVKNTKEHYHVPLLLNDFGYSTYRGS